MPQSHIQFRPNGDGEHLLERIGKRHRYKGLTFADLRPNWKTFNLGRPETTPIIETAVQDYQRRKQGGSVPEAPILCQYPRHVFEWFDICDGMQRIEVERRDGAKRLEPCLIFQADSAEEMAAIRSMLNKCLHGTPNNPEWDRENIVRHSVMGPAGKTVEEVAEITGFSAASLRAEHKHQLVLQHLEAIGAPTDMAKAFNQLLYDHVKAIWYESAREPIKGFVTLMKKCGFTVPEYELHVPRFFRRVPMKGTHDNLAKRLKQLENDEEIKARKREKIRGRANNYDIKIIKPLRSADTIIDQAIDKKVWCEKIAEFRKCISRILINLDVLERIARQHERAISKNSGKKKKRESASAT